MGFEGFLGILAVVVLFVFSAIFSGDEKEGKENEQLDKLVHILADHEHPFWSMVNTDSGAS